MIKELVVYIDGASRGNPGPSGVGVAIRDVFGGVVKDVKKYIGIGTNNRAEYTAFICALDEAKKLGANKIKICLDSQLLYKQYLGEYKIKDENLIKLMKEIRKKGESFSSIEVVNITREKNRGADKLANIAINLGETGGD